MEILVRGRNVELDPLVEQEAERKVTRLARLATDIRRVEVEFSEVRNPREAESQICEVTAHLTKHFVKGHAAAADARTALDRAVRKAQHQLETVHGKRVDRTHPR